MLPQMLRGRSLIRIAILLSLPLGAQDPTLWHGRILGVGEWHGGTGPSQQVLTYADTGPGYEHGTLTNAFQISYRLDAASSTVYVWKRNLSNEGREFQGFEMLPLTNMKARTSIDCTAVCTACPTCRSCRGPASMVTSPDGRYVYSLIERFQEHHTTFAPGQIAFDDDASFHEQVILTYDSKDGRMLADRVTLFLGQPVAYFLLPSSEPESFEILTYYPSVRLCRFSMHGSGRQNGVVLGDLGKSTGQVELAWDTANARTLLLWSDGRVIEAKGGLKQIGKIDHLGPLRRMYSASVSGDGKLLFVPTGPVRNGADRYLPARYFDLIDVYDAMSLVKLRSLRLQRPLSEVVPNRDGTKLYVPDGPIILVLNSETLWQEEWHATEPFTNRITLVP